jgi:hypothetical protein
VLGLAFLASLNPVRLALTLLVLSRPRPVRNLLAFWGGCLTGAIPAVAVPLTLLHATPMFTSLAQHSATPATHSTLQHVQIGTGALALSMAAVMSVRSLTRRRWQAQLPTPGGTASTLVLDSNTPTVISRLLGRTQDAPTEGGSAFRRVLGRAHAAWESGSSWVAFVIGLVFGGPQPGDVLVLFAVIVTAGAAIGTQVSAAIAYVVETFAVVEIILVSYLITPAKTLAVVRLLDDWVSANRRRILVVILAVVGVSMLSRGVGSV